MRTLYDMQLFENFGFIKKFNDFIPQLLPSRKCSLAKLEVIPDSKS